VDGAFDDSASQSPKKVGQAVAHLLSFFTQVEGDLRTPKVNTRICVIDVTQTADSAPQARTRHMARTK
jgi:hypothetical protein